MKIKKLKESISESISSQEPVIKFSGRSSHTFTKDKKWEVDFDEKGNIVARTIKGKPLYFKGHINDKTNSFPSTDEDNIILAARKQHSLKFGNGAALKESIDDFNFKDYEEELYKYLKSKNMYPEMYVDNDNTLCVSIQWGDWKHDHMYMNSLINNFFFNRGLILDHDMEVTEDDGSDTYSATHYYKLDDAIFDESYVDINNDTIGDFRLKLNKHMMQEDTMLEYGRYIDYNSEDGWTKDDIEFHKSIDWKSLNYRDFPVKDDSFEGTVVAYGDGEPKTKQVKFIKYFRSNPIYGPYYAPESKPFTGFVGPMYDGEKHNGYLIMNRYETQSLYDMLSESQDFEIDPEEFVDDKSNYCCICNKPFTGYGNNAEPVKSGICCDSCNLDVVIPTRLSQINKN